MATAERPTTELGYCLVTGGAGFVGPVDPRAGVTEVAPQVGASRVLVEERQELAARAVRLALDESQGRARNAFLLVEEGSGRTSQAVAREGAVGERGGSR